MFSTPWCVDTQLRPQIEMPLRESLSFLCQINCRSVFQSRRGGMYSTDRAAETTSGAAVFVDRGAFAQSGQTAHKAEHAEENYNEPNIPSQSRVVCKWHEWVWKRLKKARGIKNKCPQDIALHINDKQRQAFGIERPLRMQAIQKALNVNGRQVQKMIGEIWQILR